MRIISLAEAKITFPEAIARLEDDRSFLKEGEPLTDEHDIFVLIDDDLIFANTLDQLADSWDPVDGCWMEYLDGDEEFYDRIGELL